MTGRKGREAVRLPSESAIAARSTLLTSERERNIVRLETGPEAGIDLDKEVFTQEEVQ